MTFSRFFSPSPDGLYVLWEMDRWPDTYVRNAPPREAAATTEQPAETGA